MENNNSQENAPTRFKRSGKWNIYVLEVHEIDGLQWCKNYKTRTQSCASEHTLRHDLVFKLEREKGTGSIVKQTEIIKMYKQRVVLQMSTEVKKAHQQLLQIPNPESTQRKDESNEMH